MKTREESSIATLPRVQKYNLSKENKIPSNYHQFDKAFTLNTKNKPSIT
jgi:hypothetical protein